MTLFDPSCHHNLPKLLRFQKMPINSKPVTHPIHNQLMLLDILKPIYLMPQGMQKTRVPVAPLEKLENPAASAPI